MYLCLSLIGIDHGLFDYSLCLAILYCIPSDHLAPALINGFWITSWSATGSLNGTLQLFCLNLMVYIHLYFTGNVIALLWYAAIDAYHLHDVFFFCYSGYLMLTVSMNAIVNVFQWSCHNVLRLILEPTVTECKNEHIKSTLLQWVWLNCKQKSWSFLLKFTFMMSQMSVHWSLLIHECAFVYDLLNKWKMIHR